MGNCMERWKKEGGGERERARGSFYDDDRYDGGDDCYDDDGDDGKSGGMKVKIVLTRHELEMFLLQLSEKYDGKLMMSKDVIGELEKKMKSSSSSLSSSIVSSPTSMAWKPSLESIIECPEVQEMNR